MDDQIYYISESEDPHHININEDISLCLQEFIKVDISNLPAYQSTIDHLPITQTPESYYGSEPPSPFLMFDLSTIQFHGLEPLTSILQSVSAFTRQEKIQEIQRRNSWEEIILVYKPIRVDNHTLQKNPEILREIARSVSFYNHILYLLATQYVDDMCIDIPKWEMAMHKNKNLLYSKIKYYGEQIRTHTVPKQLVEHITEMIKRNTPIEHNLVKDIPRNVFNNLCSNTKRNMKNGKI